MFRRLRFCFGYFAWWMAYFAVIRAVFLAYNHAEAARIGFGNLAGAFVHGARMDMSAAAVLFVVLAALAVFSFLRLFGPGIREWHVGRLPHNLVSFTLIGGLAWFLY